MQEIAQLTEMVKQGAKWEEEDSEWVSMLGDLKKLREIMQKDSGLYEVIGGLADGFRQQLESGSTTRGERGLTYEDWYKEQSRAYCNAIEATLEGIDISREQMENDAKTIEEMQKRNVEADGQMQAIQVGNDIAAEIAQQLMKLQEAVNRQTAMVAAHYTLEQNKRDSDTLDMQEAIVEMDTIGSNISRAKPAKRTD